MSNFEELETLLHVAIHAGDTKQITKLSAELDAAPLPVPAASPLAAALWYAQQGLHVFALAAGGKIPHRGTRGCLDATSDEQTIRGWWDRWPDSNVAIATGHLVDVVDIDGLLGQNSRAHNWAMFETNLGTVSTPRPGGAHLYVAADPTTKDGNGAGILPGIDYRGRGGYVVAPPSVTDVGTYKWTRPLVLGAT